VGLSLVVAARPAHLDAFDADTTRALSTATRAPIAIGELANDGPVQNHVADDVARGTRFGGDLEPRARRPSHRTSACEHHAPTAGDVLSADGAACLPSFVALVLPPIYFHNAAARPAELDNRAARRMGYSISPLLRDAEMARDLRSWLLPCLQLAISRVGANH
jgi:hypothetical protein